VNPHRTLGYRRDEVYAAIRKWIKPGRVPVVCGEMERKFPSDFWGDVFPLAGILHVVFNRNKEYHNH
jgi:hypothetical protein